MRQSDGCKNIIVNSAVQIVFFHIESNSYRRSQKSLVVSTY